jgi:hypothetical protein
MTKTLFSTWTARGSLAVALAFTLGTARPSHGLVMAEAEDDLAVVRRAVASGSDASHGTPPQPPPRVESAPARRKVDSATEPHWLRVRVTKKVTGAKVKVDIPLFIARAIGAEIPLDFGCARRGRDSEAPMKLGDILDMLDSGQDVVNIDTWEASVRVFVE